MEARLPQAARPGRPLPRPVPLYAFSSPPVQGKRQQKGKGEEEEEEEEEERAASFFGFGALKSRSFVQGSAGRRRLKKGFFIISPLFFLICFWLFACWLPLLFGLFFLAFSLGRTLPQPSAAFN